jgi:N-ethylmaleimide reductase
MSANLFEPLQLGSLTLPNRILMAPMTRNRADQAGVPLLPMVATYYTQRATAGLIFSEAINVSPEAIGYPNTPGLYTDAQTESWTQVVKAVKAAGGRIFAQVFHTGRVSHPDLQPQGQLPPAPSAVAAVGELYTYQGKKSYVTPRAMTTAEIHQVVEDYRKAAQNALKAGFDGFEIHAANGYLIDQFLRDGSNQRTDEYGGSLSNRLRFLLQIVDAVVSVFGPQRTGVRISPANPYNSMSDSNPKALTAEIARQLSPLGLAYLHLIDPAAGHTMYNAENNNLLPIAREHYTGVLITNGGYDQERATAVLAAGTADAVSFGVPYLANPDLVDRFRKGIALAMPNFDLLFTGGEQGYIDYPAA